MDDLSYYLYPLDRIHKLALGDLLFLYNSAVVRPPTVSNEFHAGQGIVAVSAMLLDKNGRVVTMLPESAEMTVPLTVDESGTEPPPFSTPYTIVIHYWAQGEQLNHDAFSQQLQYSVRHAFEDYRLEIAAAAACKAQVGLGDTGKLQADAISAVGRIIAVAASSISFSVRRSVNTLHRFPNEDMETIIAELVHLLAGLGNKCQPRVLRRDKADAQLHPHSVCSTTDVPLTSTPGIDSGDRSFYIYVDFTSTSSDEAADASIQNRPRSKTGADDASLATMRRGSFQLPTPIGGVSGNGDEIMQHAQHTFNVLSTAGFSKETRQRCCFLLLRLCAGKLELVSYNWNATAFASVSSVLHDFAETWNLRHDLLASAAEQKMGLGFGAASLRVAQRGSKDVMPDVYHDVGLSTAIRKRSSSSSHIAYGSSLSACDFAHMPDDCFFEYSPIEMGAVKYQDSVLRHSIPLIHIHRKRSMEQRELQAIRSVHGSWGDRLTAPALSYHDLKRFLRTVRLFHWCRTPLLFSPLRDSLFLLSGSSYICTYTDLDNQFADPRDYHSFPDEPAALAWFRTLARTFTEEYVAYLKSLGMQVVARITDDATFVMSRDLSAKTDAVYLQKSFEGGVLLVEVRLQEMFASVNLYTGKQQMATQADESGLLEVNRQLFRVFIEECAKFSRCC